MSKAPETWYVYRHELTSSVLKAPETSLVITEVSDVWKARFELSDGEQFEVELSADAASGAWQNSKAGLDFRLDRIAPDVLIGQVCGNPPTECRDSFVAVRSRRTIRLFDQEVFHFGSAQYTPYERDVPYEPKSGDASVDLSTNKVTLDGTIYTIKQHETPPEGGIKLKALHRNTQGTIDESLRLWILPTDGTRHLLATGFLFMRGPHESEAIILSGAGDPHCTHSLQLC